MALVEVSCPGCGSILKAPDTMAGKRAKCKKCETRFVIPGGSGTEDSGGDSQMLSVLEMPAAAPASPPPASTFDFGAMLDAPPEPKKAAPEAKKSAPVAKPQPRVEAKPSKASPPPPPTASDPFDFFAAGAAAPEPPAPKPAEAPKPKAVAKPPAAPPAAPKAKSAPPSPPAAKPKPTPQTQAPAAAAGGFDFGAMLDDPPAPEPTPDSDDEEIPQAESVPEAMSLDDEPTVDSDDPFGFPGGGSTTAESDPSPSTRSKMKGKDAKTATKPGKAASSSGSYRGYRQQSSGGGKMKLILAGVGLLVLGGAIAGVAVYVSKQKNNAAQAGKKDDKDKSGDTEGPPAGTPNDPVTPDTKDAKTTPTGKKEPPKKDPSGKTIGPNPMAKLPDRPTLTLPGSLRSITLQPARPKPEVFVETNGPPLPIDAEFSKVRRLMPPGRADLDIGILWEREGVAGVPGNKLVMDVCRPSGTRQYQIEFTGDGKAVPAADLSEDGRWFAHGEGSKVTVWKVEDKTKLVEGWDVYAMLPEQHKAGLAAVYFPMIPKDKRELPPDRLVTVATDGTVHLWDLAAKTPLGSYTPPNGRPNRVVEGRGVALSQLRGFVVVAVGGTVFKASFDGGGVDITTLAELGADVPLSMGVATYGETTVYAFETGTDKKERAVMLLNRGSKVPKTYRWPDDVGQPVGVGWIASDLVAVSTNRGGAVLFDYNDENTSFLPKYAVLPPDNKAIHATTDVSHWYLIPNPNDPMRCMLVQVSPPSGNGLLDDAPKGGGIPLGRIDVRGLSK